MESMVDSECRNIREESTFEEGLSECRVAPMLIPVK